MVRESRLPHPQLACQRTGAFFAAAQQLEYPQAAVVAKRLEYFAGSSWIPAKPSPHIKII
jgi:hypothetical protein